MIPKLITIHCSASPNGEELPAKTIDEWHKKRGWKSCGYHIVCQPSGLIENAGNSPCRGLNEEGAGVEGANKDNIHVCLVGTDKFTYDQLWGFRYQIESLMGLFELSPWHLRAHYSFPSAIKQGKTCPNVPIENLIMWIVWADIRTIEDYVISSS